MIIRVKKNNLEKKNKKKRKGERARERERRGQQRHWEGSLLNHDFSVEVGYGLISI